MSRRKLVMDKCMLFSIVLAVLAGVAFIAYMRCRKCCAPSTATPKTMSPTKITLYGLRYPFTLPPLPYAYNALEPHIDAQTMTLHHTKHHQAYIDNVNKALQEAPEYQKYTLEELIANIDALPTSIRERVRNNGGGHFNHTLFWELMSPQGGGMPTEVVAQAINQSFGSFAAFKEQFEKAAQGRFGSGWEWLCMTPEKKLVIISTANQDAPLAQGYYPILALDVWEHAYYLKYQNKRVDYMSAWWNVVNWKHVEKLYQDALKAI